MREPKNPYKVKSARFDAWNDGYDLGYECGISEGEAGVVEVLDDYEKLQAEIIKLKENWIDMKKNIWKTSVTLTSNMTEEANMNSVTFSVDLC